MSSFTKLRSGGIVQSEAFREALLSREDLAAGQFLREISGGRIDALVVLGSGLAATLEDHPRWGKPVVSIPLSAIPGVMSPVADGHMDELRVYQVDFDGRALLVAVALGRTHLYEGWGPGPVTALPRAATAAGARVAILCNANGCLRDWNLGDVMVIEDHVNLTGTSPFDGTIFLDTSKCWDPALAAAIAEVSQRQGSYALLRGPEYQAPLETRILAGANIDTVGMSTVMEALMLHALGVRVAGMSVVSELSFATQPTDPEAVVETAAQAKRTVVAGIEAALKRLVGEEGA